LLARSFDRQLDWRLAMWFQNWQRPRISPRRHCFRPRLEALDDRLVPSTLTVTNTSGYGTAGDGSLRGEIAAAYSGDKIVFDPSLSGQTITLNPYDGELVINKNLTIQGPGAPLSPVTISGFNSRVFEVDGTGTVVSLSNLNIVSGNGVALNSSSRGATDGDGGAIWNGGTLTINGCNLSNNTAINGFGLGLGGAIYNAGTLTVSNSTLDNNSVYLSNFDHTYFGSGGAIYNAYRASATITAGSLSGNFAAVGSGIYNDGVMTLSGSTVSGNGVDGIFNDQKGHLSIQSKCSVVSNSTDDLFNLGSVKISADSDVGVIRT
jgi:hypothetical protein